MPHTDAGAKKISPMGRAIGRALVVTAAMLLLAVLPACSLLGVGGEGTSPEDGGDPNSDVESGSGFPTDEEFAAQQAALNGEQAQANTGGNAASQITDLAAQLTEEKIRSAGLQGTVDGLAAKLSASEAARVSAVSSTIDQLAAQLAASDIARIEAVSSTIAEFTSDYISMERARLEAIRYARDNPEIYGDAYLGVSLAWELLSEVESKEFYYIRLNYRPSGTFLGTPGIEEFTMNKEGKIEFRQILQEPNDEVPPPAPDEGDVVEDAAAVDGATAATEGGSDGGTEGEPTATEGPTEPVTADGDPAA